MKSVKSVAKKTKKRRAFTLMELVVAVALLVLMLTFSGIIFKVSIESYRTASANVEIMQKLRVITDQLNADFKGLQKDAPLAIEFKLAGLMRYDQIVLLAVGDFQSTRQYSYNKPGVGTALKTVCGNVASIYYGQAANDPNILIRKQKILTYDGSLVDTPYLYDPNEFIKSSLAQWKVSDSNSYFNNWILRLNINPSLEEYIPMYMFKGIGDFKVELAEWDNVNKKCIWEPNDLKFNSPPSGLDSNTDGIFGFFFNIRGGVKNTDWYDWSPNYPKALKFTFTLYDSKNIIKGERLPFTHIVYLD